MHDATDNTSTHLGALHSMTKGIKFGLRRLKVDIPARCVVLTQLVLQVAENQGLHLPSVDLAGVENNPLMTSLRSQGGAQRQPKRLPLLVPDFESVANFLCEDVTGGQPGKRAKLSEGEAVVTEGGETQFLYEVFGLHWDWKNFVDRAIIGPAHLFLSSRCWSAS